MASLNVPPNCTFLALEIYYRKKEYAKQVFFSPLITAWNLLDDEEPPTKIYTTIFELNNNIGDLQDCFNETFTLKERKNIEKIEIRISAIDKRIGWIDKQLINKTIWVDDDGLFFECLV